MDPGAAFAHPPAEALAAIGTLIGIDPDFAAILERAGPCPGAAARRAFRGCCKPSSRR